MPRFGIPATPPIHSQSLGKDRHLDGRGCDVGCVRWRAMGRRSSIRLRSLRRASRSFGSIPLATRSQWTDTLRMHEVIATAVDPTTALSVGLKVDAEALPPAVVAGIRNGSIDLKSPETTVRLLKLNAVVGVQGKVETINGKDTLTRVGITCAFAIRPWTTRSRPASASAWTVGPIAISTRARSLPCRRR